MRALSFILPVLLGLLVISLVGLTGYGLYLAFSASVVLGIIVLFLEPSPLLIGLVMFFFEKNLAQMLLDWLNN